MIGTAITVYETYKTFHDFDNDVKSCIVQCGNTAACGDPERTALLQDNQSRCIATCKGYSTLDALSGAGKGPTGPTSEANPNYFKRLPPANGKQ